jgi:hypothetical protein
MGRGEGGVCGWSEGVGGGEWSEWLVSDCNAIAAGVSRTTLKDCRAARRLTKKSSSPTASPFIVSMRITEESERGTVMNERDSTPSSDADDLRLVMIPVTPTSSRIQSLIECGKDLLETSGRYSLAPRGECLVEFMASEIRTKLNAGGLAQSSWRIFANRGQRDGKAYSIAEHDNGLRILVIEDGHVMNYRDSRDYVDNLFRRGEYTNLLTNIDN